MPEQKLAIPTVSWWSEKKSERSVKVGHKCFCVIGMFLF